MTVEKLTRLSVPDFGRVRDRRRPVLSYEWRAPGPHRASAHRHPRGHVIQTVTGAYWVVTPEGTWLVPPGQAIWIPPMVYHEVYSHGPVSARILFVDPDHAHALPARSGTVKFSRLLTELLQRTVAHGNDYPADGPAARLALVMLDELAAIEFAPLLVPVSKDTRLARVLARLVTDPAARGNLDAIAKAAGASPRTLARLFQRETGMTYTQWKTRLVLVEAIDRLARGATVTEVALDLGYRSISSFVYMFRSNLGVSPGRYPRARP